MTRQHPEKPTPAGLAGALEETERAHIIAALERADGPRGAAKLLDIHAAGSTAWPSA
jgi:hypothetical protein